MRNNFNLQLNELHEDLKKMGTLCEDCITFATQSLLLGDTELGERAIQAEKQTDIMEKEIQNLCMRILLQQQPVASDLRTISAAIKVITDMERIGGEFLMAPVDNKALKAKNMRPMKNVTPDIPALVLAEK